MDLPLTASSPIFFHIFGLTSNCHLFKFSFFYLDLPLIVSFSIFHFFLYLDLPLIASSSNFYFFLWTYLWLPVLQIFIFLYMDLPLIASKTQLNSSNKFDRLDPLSLGKSCFNSLQKHILDFHFFIFFMLSPTPLHFSSFFYSLIIPSMPDLVGFSFFIFSKMQIQMLCLNYADEMLWLVLPMWYANIVP